jgi:phosphatidate cytidylyltransferase
MAPLSAIAERRNLTDRVLSGMVMGPLVIALVLFGGWVFDIAAAAAAAVGLGEWLRLVTGRAMVWGYALPAALILAYRMGGITAGLAVLVLLTICLFLLGARPGVKRAELAFGLPYVGLTLLALSWLRNSAEAGLHLVLFVILVIWATDIGAFFAGRTFGGPRLAPRISPNKTWSGFAGGLVLAGMAGLAWAVATQGAAGFANAVLIAVVLSVAGQGGDLFESAAKRRFGVKDSGNLIPGHGGMLDRIDALLVAAPLFALLYFSGLATGISQ